jgi:hypothetical protein
MHNTSPAMLWKNSAKFYLQRRPLATETNYGCWKGGGAGYNNNLRRGQEVREKVDTCLTGWAPQKKESGNVH